jgi:hypothetical protein
MVKPLLFLLILDDIFLSHPFLRYFLIFNCFDLNAYDYMHTPVKVNTFPESEP